MRKILSFTVFDVCEIGLVDEWAYLRNVYVDDTKTANSLAYFHLHFRIFLISMEIKLNRAICTNVALMMFQKLSRFFLEETMLLIIDIVYYMQYINHTAEVL